MIIKYILSAVLLITIYFLVNNILSKKPKEKLFSITQNNYKKRKEEKNKLEYEEGNVKITSFMGKMDILIERSNLRKKFPSLNSEIYIFTITLLTIIGFTIANNLSGWLLGLTVAITIVLTGYAILYYAGCLAYDRIDREVLKFINVLENFSDTNDDIVAILGKTTRYLNDPFKSYISDFHKEATTTGDVGTAFKRLESKIENPVIRDVIRHLDICSRHEANYKEIITDIRYSVKSYLKSKEKNKAITRNGRIELLVCISIMAIMLKMFEGFVPGLFIKLTTALIGKVILVYLLIVFAIIVWNFISFDKGY